jgi:hypothetical protein
MTRNPTALIALLVLALAACSGAASTPAASSDPTSGPPSAAPSGPSASTPIASVEEAAARVIEFNPSLAGIGPFDPNLIGGCCHWKGAEADDGFTVTFEVGWGDCPAGCIERHTWTYSVTRDGAVTLTGDRGDPVPPDVPGGQGGGGSSGSSGGADGALPPAGDGDFVLVEPLCPVERPDDPSCADQPQSP